mmetsp:Transcript_25643/g.56558  ORF Transcript_25643/g.56558 Transcript_25643/m.56558 type:complete len:144 (+) Transcript_25643:317-748(+)
MALTSPSAAALDASHTPPGVEARADAKRRLPAGLASSRGTTGSRCPESLWLFGWPFLEAKTVATAGSSGKAGSSLKRLLDETEGASGHEEPEGVSGQLLATGAASGEASEGSQAMLARCEAGPGARALALKMDGRGGVNFNPA